MFVVSILKIIFPKGVLINQAYKRIKDRIHYNKWVEKFKNLEFKNYENCFYYVYPFPKESDVKEYYSTQYQSERDRLDPFKITKRDLTNFSFLKKEFNFEDKNILNFGCGKSGFSYLSKLLGAKVTEVDLKEKIETNFDENISFTNNLEDLKGSKFDLIYSAHSLEHISNLKKTLQTFAQISKENTCFFFEVPDGELEFLNLSNRILSHFFLYQKAFFEKIFLKTNNDIFLNIYDNKNLNKFSNTSNKDVIIAWTNGKLNSEFINKIII